jgi:hypothetical protein
MSSSDAGMLIDNVQECNYDLGVIKDIRKIAFKQEIFTI